MTEETFKKLLNISEEAERAGIFQIQARNEYKIYERKRKISLWLGTIIGLSLYFVFAYFMVNKPYFLIDILKYIFISYAITDMTIQIFRNILL